MTFMEKLRLTLEVDEGIVFEIYDDHLGHKTTGIGHLIIETDREFGMPVGTPVDAERVTELFEADIASVLRDVEYLFPDFDKLPDQAQVTCASLMFQLGLPRYTLFSKHRVCIELGDWYGAARELRNSRLYQQTPNRTERHAQRLESIA